MLSEMFINLSMIQTSTMKHTQKEISEAIKLTLRYKIPCDTLKRLDGVTQNLHAYWDSGATVLQPNDDLLVRPLNDTGFAYTQQWATNAMNKYPKDSFAGRDMRYSYPLYCSATLSSGPLMVIKTPLIMCTLSSKTIHKSPKNTRPKPTKL